MYEEYGQIPRFVEEYAEYCKTTLRAMHKDCAADDIDEVVESRRNMDISTDEAMANIWRIYRTYYGGLSPWHRFSV